MRREAATWDVDLPHTFRASRRTEVCWCGRSPADDLHEQQPADTPERAAQAVITEKGT
jgi:hypothetical protein